jgi:hypothetical protein
MIVVQYRARDFVVDDACIARAQAEGRDPVEYRLWEAGFSLERAKEEADKIRKAAETRNLLESERHG